MASHDYETITYEERNGVAIVTLNRPDVYNAFNRAMENELQLVWRSLRGNDDVREFYLGLSAAGRRKSFREVKFYKRRKRWAF